ncbi:hypothetical protein YC2023_101202 [Brassica napus]
MSFVEMQIVFIKDENHIYRVYRGAKNHEHLRSSDLRWGDEEFTSEKIDYEQTHGATLVVVEVNLGLSSSLQTYLKKKASPFVFCYALYLQQTLHLPIFNQTITNGIPAT